ncbi:DUF6049 family protein [Agrococcus carbonis]|uniref:Uncharacterized protein n=1 Tax=Agrococcus carbonis TaxID=684552 RepID=A0A1H1PEA1_9MICO|nr:DUF6049 family protein [Agrococcus carbonis]SDS09420.1 hypothetical protein SAMN04489719_1530 [Agrococcus carbonis]
MLSAGRLARWRAGACALAALATAVVTAGGAAPTPAVAAAQPDPAPSVVVAPVDPLLSDGETLRLDVTVDNPGSAETPAASLEVLLTTAPIGTRYGLSRWYDGDAILASSAVGTVDVPAVPAGDRQTVRVVIEAEQHGLDDRPWGTYGVAASAPEIGSGASVVVHDEPGDASPTTLALAAPIGSGVRGDGLLTADELERATEPGGELRVLVGAAREADATLGIDPAFGASAAALGDEAPSSVRDWLDRADTASTYPLLYGNADPIAQVRAGVFPVEPLGIPRPDDDPLPATTGLVGTRQPVIDATESPVRQAELESLAAVGTVVLSTEALDEQLEGSTPSARARIDGVDVLAADAQLQQLLHEMGTAADAAESRDLQARIVGLLATITRERPSDPRTLVGVLPTQPGSDAAGLLGTLAAAGFVETAGIDAALETEPRDASLLAVDEAALGDGADLVLAALEQEADVSSIASIVDEPERLLAELRLSLLAALPDAGREITDADRRAIDNLGTAMGEMRGAVQIIGGSPIHAVGESVPLPITIANQLDVPAHVVLSVRPTNALVTVPEPRVDVTIAPDSQQRVQVPIDVVGTGSLLLIAQLHTPDGQPIGELQLLRISAQPTIEAVVAWALAIAIVLLLGFGILRSIQKRRRGQAHGDIDDLAAREPREAATEGAA